MTRAQMLFRIGLPVAGLALLGAFVWQARQASGAGAPAASLAAPTQRSGTRAEGRLAAYPGAQVTVGTDVSGTVARVLVHERDRVRRGQMLVELVASEQRAELQEARARIMEAEADLRLARNQTVRWQTLRDSNLASQDRLDQAIRDRDAAQARLDLSTASAQRLEAVLAKMRVVSPIDGVVITRSVEPGQPLAAGDPLVTVADLDRMRIEAEVDEYDVGRIRLGDGVQVTAEGFAGQSWQGRVEEIPDAVVPRRLKPEDPGRPSDTRVLLVKIALQERTPLKLGQRVELDITSQGH